jgi:predicted nucleic acid-binding protein
MIVVADTSPITALLHVKQVALLNKLYGQVFVPEMVAGELNTLISFGYDISFLKEQNNFVICKAQDYKFVNNLSKYLDAGEAEAIALAKELTADLLLIDEKLGKQYAEAENITCKGAVGILIRSKGKRFDTADKTLVG